MVIDQCRVDAAWGGKRDIQTSGERYWLDWRALLRRRQPKVTGKARKYRMMKTKAAHPIGASTSSPAATTPSAATSSRTGSLNASAADPAHGDDDSDDHLNFDDWRLGCRRRCQHCGLCEEVASRSPPTLPRTVQLCSASCQMVFAMGLPASADRTSLKRARRSGGAIIHYPGQCSATEASQAESSRA